MGWTVDFISQCADCPSGQSNKKKNEAMSYIVKALKNDWQINSGFHLFQIGDVKEVHFNQYIIFESIFNRHCNQLYVEPLERPEGQRLSMKIAK